MLKLNKGGRRTVISLAVILLLAIPIYFIFSHWYLSDRLLSVPSGNRSPANTSNDIYCDITNYQQYIYDKAKMVDLIFATGKGCNLQRADLPGINLEGASLVRSDLQWANLSGAKLSKTDLRASDLKYANFQKADLQRTIINRSDLLKTDFRGSDLRGAYLQGTNLEEAYLKGAIYNQYTDLPGWDLLFEPQEKGMVFSAETALLPEFNFARPYL